MALQVICPHCGATLWVPEEYAGRTGVCHACGGMVRAPESPLRSAASLPASPRWDSTVEWAVILDALSLAKLSPAEHGPALSRALGLGPEVVGDGLRNGQGIIARGRTRHLADVLVAALRSLGLTSAAVPDSMIATPAPAIHVRRLTWDDRDLVAPGDPEVRVAWDAVMALNRGRAPGGQLVADIMSDSPQARFRVSSGTFDFSLLGEAAPRTPNANMRLLLSQLVMRCQRVVLSPPTPDLQPSGDTAEVDPADASLFEARTVWLYNLARLGAAVSDRQT